MHSANAQIRDEPVLKADSPYLVQISKAPSRAMAAFPWKSTYPWHTVLCSVAIVPFTPLKNCLCEPISDGAPKSQHKWIQGHKGHSHILFFGKSPNYTLDAKNRSSLIRTSPWPDSRGGSPRRDPYCSTTFIMKETLAVAAQQISILKDWIEFDSAGRNFSPSISSYGWLFRP